MKTQVEIELEAESLDDDEEDEDGAALPPEPIIEIEEEEDVVLMWDCGKKSKSIRDLAAGVKDGHKEDRDMLNYYRYLWHETRLINLGAQKHVLNLYHRFAQAYMYMYVSVAALYGYIFQCM